MQSLVVERDLTLKVEDGFSMPKYGDCQVLVKVLAGGICTGTDMKILHGAMKGIDKNTYPALLGHESVGEVIATGKLVEQFKVGDKILLPYVDEPDKGYSSYYGGFSEYGVCNDWKALAKIGKGPGTPWFNESHLTQKTIPADFDPVDSTMIVTFREVLSGVKAFGLSANDSLVVFGAGPVGMSFIKFAKLLGLSPVISVDIMDEKAVEAAKMGADFFFNSTKVNVISEVKKILPEGADHVVDAVGVNALINLAMQLVKPDGQICTYGISPKMNMELDWSLAPYNWNLRFLQWPRKAQEAAAHNQIVGWIQAGALDRKSARRFRGDREKAAREEDRHHVLSKNGLF